MKHRILFVHYVIGASDGVNRVIETNINGLKKILDVEVALAGRFIGEVNRADQYFDIKELSEQGTDDEMHAALIEKKLNEAAKGFGIVVIENPTLGKFPAATIAFHNFVMNNPDKKVFYRIHDLAEDRPNYMKVMMKFENCYDLLYPKFPNLMYIPINSHDSELLEKRHVPGTQIFYVPNGVDEQKLMVDEDGAELKARLGLKHEKIILYPVRTVERKNIEEAIFLTLILRKLLKEDYVLCVTLGPNARHNHEYATPILNLIEKKKLPAVIGFGNELIKTQRTYEKGKIKSFAMGEAYKMADLVITTSVMEGFGYATVEPWFLKKLLIGRAINFINRDFKNIGMKLDHLYPHLLVGEGVDFKNLTQKQKLEIIDDFDSVFDKIYRLNKENLDRLASLIKGKDRFRLVEHNSGRVKTHFSLVNATNKFADALGISVRKIVKSWFLTNTFDSDDFNVEMLVRLKGSQKISVCIPTLNEEKTIGKTIDVCSKLKKQKLVDEILVIDSGSTDRTQEIAVKAGAAFYKSEDYLKDDQIIYGKGENLWTSLYLSEGDIIVWLDADIENIAPHFICGLIGPLLADERIGYVKGFYERPLKLGDRIIPTGGGRVTEILGRPLFSMFYPELTGFIQPYSGEYAGRRKILEQIPFFVGYGVETGMLIDILNRFGLHSMAQVDLKKRIHRNHQTHTLGKMAFGITQVVMKRLHEQNKLKMLAEFQNQFVFPVLDNAVYSLGEKEILELERPPIMNVKEYRDKFYKQN
jgi:glucosyl-3-phosphoglycerate synthase